VPHDERFLDRLGLSIPLVIRDIGGHLVCANTCAIDKVLAGPNGADINSHHEANLGNGTFQGKWVDIFFRLRSQDQFLECMRKGMLHGLHHMTRHGICAVLDAFVSEDRIGIYNELYNCLDSSTSPAFRAASTSDLPRVCLALGLRSNDDIPAKISRVVTSFPALVCPRPPSDRRLLRLQETKLEVDGAFALGSAFTHKAYTAPDGTKTCGAPRFRADQVVECARECVRRDWSCHFHAIGSGAVDLALKCLEQAEGELPSELGDDVERVGGHTQRKRKTTEGGEGNESSCTPSAMLKPQRVHKIAHVIHSRPEDHSRFAACRAVAVMTPQWFSVSRNASSVALFDVDESDNFQAVGRLLSHGDTVVFGSDWDVTTASPLVGIATVLDPSHTTLSPTRDQSHGAGCQSGCTRRAECISSIRPTLRPRCGGSVHHSPCSSYGNGRYFWQPRRRQRGQHCGALRGYLSFRSRKHGCRQD